MKKILSIIVCFVLLPFTAVAQSTNNHVVVAYVTSWTSMTPDPFVMTHINYAFGGVGGDYTSVYADNTSRMQKLIDLKKKNPDLKVLLSVGGWGRGNFTPMAKDETKRKAFAKACRAFCDKYKLDGIDIDWEFPGNNSSGESSPSNEKQNYTLLMRDLREALGKDLLLTMASQGDPGNYDFRSCVQYLDFVNIMSYDLSGPPNHHSALYRGGTVGNGWLVASECVDRHINAGVPASKLVMGMPFYGSSGTGSQISLQEIENGIASGKWKDHWDNTAQVPYVTDASTGKFAYGYDNERSLTLKCEYLLRKKLLGGMYWEYGNDNNKGTLRNTVAQCLLGSFSKTDKMTFGDLTLPYAGANVFAGTLQLQQNTTYAYDGPVAITPEEWYIDPDFFRVEENGAFAFLPISGTYRVEANCQRKFLTAIPVDAEGQPLAYSSSDASGCIWLIGANGSVGKPAHASTDDTAWEAANAIPFAPMGNRQYQLTLTVGQQLNPDFVNFKLFLQNELDDNMAFAASGRFRVSCSYRTFTISTESGSIGNFRLASGRKLTEGQTLVFTIDASSPSSIKLSVKQATAIDGVTASPEAPAQSYNLLGQPLSPDAPGIHVAKGKKYTKI